VPGASAAYTAVRRLRASVVRTGQGDNADAFDVTYVRQRRVGGGKRSTVSACGLGGGADGSVVGMALRTPSWARSSTTSSSLTPARQMVDHLNEADGRELGVSY
jgi:hypothetical protein